MTELGGQWDNGWWSATGQLRKSLWTALDTSPLLDPPKLLLCQTVLFWSPDLWDFLPSMTSSKSKQIIFMMGYDESILRTLPINQIFRYLQNRSRVQAQTNCNFDFHEFSIFFHIVSVSTLFNRCVNYWSGLAPWASGPANWGPHFGLWWVSWSKFSAVIVPELHSRSMMPSQKACNWMDTICWYVLQVHESSHRWCRGQSCFLFLWVTHSLLKWHRGWGRISAHAGNLGEKEDPSGDWLVPEGLCSTAEINIGINL